jgi:integrase
VEISEERKQTLRRMRAGTHWAADILPDGYERAPEYLQCIEHGLHFDSVIGYVEQGGGVLTHSTTAAEAADLADASREKFAPSYDALWDRTFDAWASEDVRDSDEYIGGQARNWTNHVRGNEIAIKPINRVTEEEAKLFIAQLPLGVDGRRKIKQHFARLSKGALKQNWIRFCPFEDVKIKAPRTVEDDPTKFYHPGDEYPLILEGARDEDAREYFGFSMGCGPRPNEGKAFRWEDINLAGKKLTFRFGRDGSPTKGGRPLTVDMLPEAEQWLIRRVNRLHGGSPPTNGVIFGKTRGKDKGGAYARNYNFGLNDTLRAAGIDPQERGLYGLRHGFCTALANGFYGPGWEDASKAQKLMRHKKLETTLVYYHVLEETLEEKANQSKTITSLDDFPPKADGAFGADPFSNEDDFRGSERANPSESFQIRKGRSGTDANGPFRGLAKRQQKQYFPNDRARVHASPCSRHVTRSHMIKDRHGTLTAPRRDKRTRT